MTTVTIPGSVTSIGDFAFYQCASQTSVIIRGGATSIEEDAFYDCPRLTGVYCGSNAPGVSAGSQVFNDDNTDLTVYYL